MDSPASNSSRTTINDLPCEMLLKVFSYLNQDQLLNTVPKVCKRWVTLHSDPTLYRRFTLTKQEQSTDEVIKLLGIAKWLESLELDDRTDTNAILEGVRFQRLETLILRNCRGSPYRKAISSVSLLRVLGRCNLLQHLSLKGSHCEDIKLYNEIGLRLPALRSVDLGNPTRFDSQALVNIADKCSDLEEIRAYDTENLPWLNSFTITDSVVISLCKQLQNLKILKIAFQSCTDASMITLARCERLTSLDLNVAHRITDIGIMAISDMPQLVKLSVRDNCQITSHGWSAFLQRPIMRRLQKLRLFRCYNVNQEARDVIFSNPYDLRQLYLLSDEVNCVRFFNPGNQ